MLNRTEKEIHLPNAKVAVITGGGAGIGKACAQRFAKEGYRVAIGDLSEEDGEQTLALLKESGAEALFRKCNVASEADCHALAKSALDKWGRIDVLVANAGARVFGSILDATKEDWELILGVNLKGAAYSCKAVLPAMIEQQTGSLVTDPLYPVALLKVAMKLKRLEPSAEEHFESLLDEVLDGMVIDREDFREYVKKHLGRLTAAARTY